MAGSIFLRGGNRGPVPLSSIGRRRTHISTEKTLHRVLGLFFYNQNGPKFADSLILSSRFCPFGLGIFWIALTKTRFDTLQLHYLLKVMTPINPNIHLIQHSAHLCQQFLLDCVPINPANLLCDLSISLHSYLFIRSFIFIRVELQFIDFSSFL